MPFWLHDPSFLYKARRYSSFQRILISGLFLGILGIGSYSLLHYYLIRTHFQEIKNHRSITKEIQSYQTLLSQYNQDISCNEFFLDYNLKKINFAPCKQHDVINYLITGMKKHHLSCLSLVPVKKADTNGAQSALLLNAQASFGNLISFLKDTNTADYPIEFYDVTITRYEKDELNLKAEVKINVISS